MAVELDQDRLQELAESGHVELESFYRRMRDLKELITLIHDDYVAKGTPPPFDRVEAMHLMADDIYDELERYLSATCGPDVAVHPVEQEV